MAGYIKKLVADFPEWDKDAGDRIKAAFPRKFDDYTTANDSTDPLYCYPRVDEEYELIAIQEELDAIFTKAEAVTDGMIIPSIEGI